MERLFLIRHGETEGTVKRKFMGKTDLPLNSDGRREAALLADRLKGEKVHAFYASPLKRAVETAKILKRFHNAPLRKRKAFEEIGFGKWEGLTLDEMYNRDRELCQKWFEDLENFAMPQGESIKNMRQRVIRGWEEVSLRHLGGTVAIITHGGPIRILLCHILKLDLSFFWKIRQDTASLNILTFEKGGTFEKCPATLTLLNSTCTKKS